MGVGCFKIIFSHALFCLLNEPTCCKKAVCHCVSLVTDSQREETEESSPPCLGKSNWLRWGVVPRSRSKSGRMVEFHSGIGKAMRPDTWEEGHSGTRDAGFPLTVTALKHVCHFSQVHNPIDSTTCSFHCTRVEMLCSNKERNHF